jgi:dienelactone hydrolase
VQLCPSRISGADEAPGPSGDGRVRPAYIGPSAATRTARKGPSMSEDTRGLVLTPPARNYSPWYQWMSRLAATTHEDPLPEHDPAALPAWVERRRSQLADLLGPEPQAVPLDLETLESEACDGYRRDKIVFDTEDTMSVPAYLLVPDARVDQPPGPAVLACHGHGPGKTQVVGLEHTDMPNADYALQLVRRGYVVLAPDLRCFGERLDWNPEDHYECDTNLVHAAMAGWNPLAQNIWDLRRSLDVLEQHPLVDPARLGMVGISYGGTVTLFTAAVDTRVAASVVSGYFSSWAVSHRMPWNMCGSQILVGMLGRLEHEDLGALVAPRPLLVESGTEDDLFPFATAAESVRRTRLVYEQLGAGDRLVHDIFEGGHQWHGTEALPFLDHWLGLSHT